MFKTAKQIISKHLEHVCHCKIHILATQKIDLLTFVDGIAILATHKDPKIAHSILQQHLLQIKQ